MNRVFLGDCRDTMRKLIADGVRVQCIVTSPPYWGLRDYGVDGQIGLEPTFAEFLAQLVEVFDLCRQLLADDGTCWVNMGDSYAGSWGAQGKQGHGDMTSRSIVEARQVAAAARRSSKPGSLERLPAGVKAKDMIGQPWRLAFALQEAGWWLRQDIIWAKPNPMPESVRDRCTKGHEYVFLLTKSAKYSIDMQSIAEPVADASIARLSQPRLHEQQGSDRVPGKVNGPMRAVGGTETRNKRSVWTIPTESFDGTHFAVMPEGLVEPCILAGSRVGEIVFDPFAGSGTVARVAQRLGRQWIGCELNPEYVELDILGSSNRVWYPWPKSWLHLHIDIHGLRDH